MGSHKTYTSVKICYNLEFIRYINSMDREKLNHSNKQM
jgi:hypothetical protein